MKLYNEGEVFLETEYTKLMTACQDVKIIKYTLKDGEKVYIDPVSDMPRLKFKKNFPNNKIVHDPSEADVYIASGSNFAGYTGSYPFYTRSSTGWAPVPSVVVDKSQVGPINKLVKRAEISTSGKPIIRDTDVLYKGEIPRIMSDSEYQTICQMVGSGEKEMTDLGMTMLLGFDHTINEKNYVLILAQVKARYWMKRSRLLKAIQKSLKVKYVNLR